MSLQTIYAELNEKLADQLRSIKLLVCDVDGVFSDGRIYLGNNGEELKAFHTRDGYGVKALAASGIDIAVITGRRSNIVEDRMKALNVKHIVQGEENKQAALQHILKNENRNGRQVAVVGDDIPDTGMFSLAAVRIAVADAHPLVKQQASWITTHGGGRGAVREIADTLLHVQGKLRGIQGSSV